MSAAWTTKPLKRACGINRDNLGEDTRQDWEMQYLDISAVDSDGNVAALETHTFSKAPSRARRRVRSGDTVISTVRTYLKAIAHFEQPAENLIASTGFAILSPTDQLDSRFLWRAVQDHSFISQVVANSEGVGYPAIAPTRLAGLLISLPPLAEQQRIAGYLDEATGKVDRLVALRRRQMELLREQRAALIQQAVTGGLNPKATLKDSGLPWLGQIPKHWKIKRLKHLSPRQSVGLVINPSTYVVDEGIPFLFGSDISEGSISIEKVRRISPESNALLKASRLNAGDLVSVRVGYPGITAVIPPELDQCNCASLLIIRQSKSFHSQWLCHTMNSPVGRFQVGLVQYGAAQEQFNVGHAVDFVFPTPPLAEQREIADFIDSEYVRLGQLNAAYTRQLELLTEYRAALIHESVTGQRAVPAIRLAEKPAGRYAALET